jgi:hypothetical protein
MGHDARQAKGYSRAIAGRGQVCLHEAWPEQQILIETFIARSSNGSLIHQEGGCGLLARTCEEMAMP